MRLIDRPGPLVAARRRRSATARVLLLVVVVIIVATAIVWGVNERYRAQGTGPGGPGPAEVPAVTLPAAASPAIVIRTPTAVPTATPAPTPSPTALPTATLPPTATPIPTPTPLPTMTPTPVVVTGCVEPAAVPAPAGPTQLIAEVGINLRQQPGLSCPIVSPILPFTEMTALSGPVSADGLTWIRVNVAGFTGWVATNNLREPANG